MPSGRCRGGVRYWRQESSNAPFYHRHRGGSRSTRQTGTRGRSGHVRTSPTMSDEKPGRSPNVPAEVQGEGVFMSNEPANKPDDDKWQWDAVTWSFVTLVAVFVLLMLLMVWPHTQEGQMIRHVKGHATQE